VGKCEEGERGGRRGELGVGFCAEDRREKGMKKISQLSNKNITDVIKDHGDVILGAQGKKKRMIRERTTEEINPSERNPSHIEKRTKQK